MLALAPLEYQKAKFNLAPNESKIHFRKGEWKAEQSESSFEGYMTFPRYT